MCVCCCCCCCCCFVFVVVVVLLLFCFYYLFLFIFIFMGGGGGGSGEWPLAEKWQDKKSKRTGQKIKRGDRKRESYDIPEILDTRRPLASLGGKGGGGGLDVRCGGGWVGGWGYGLCGQKLRDEGVSV